MNPAPTKLQQIEAELAETRAKIAKLEKAQKLAKKPPKPAKTDQKLKKAIHDYINSNKLRRIVDWIECDGSIDGFYDNFGGWTISERMAILENSQVSLTPGKMEKYLNYKPEDEESE